jgi:hypothetical protein
MTPNVEPLRPSKQAGSTRVYCGTCGHSQFVHEDDGDRRCLYSVCDCNRFVVGAEARDPSARSLPPGIRACSPEGWGTDLVSVPNPPAFVPGSLYAVADCQASATWKTATTRMSAK